MKVSPMTQSDYLKSSTTWSNLQRDLARFIEKKRRRQTRLERLVGSPLVARFRDHVQAALTAQLEQATHDRVLERAVATVQKLSDYDRTKILTVITQEFGSFNNFISDQGITLFLTTVYDQAANEILISHHLPAQFALKNPIVRDYLRDRTSYLINSVDETTKDTLVELIGDGVDAGDNWQEIARTIRIELPEIARYRSELIAREETANAYRLSQNDFFSENGFTTHRWVLAANHNPDTCDGSCDDNANMGDIPIRESFLDTHINCQCVEDSTDDPLANGAKWLGE